MMPVDFNTLAQQCAPSVHPTTLEKIVGTESSFNPFAIGIVGARLVRQPKNRVEAIATAKALEAEGWNYSLGLSQVNRSNLSRFGMDADTAFDPCANLRAGSAILSDCYSRASARTGAGQTALRAALSCYYSGNFKRGFVRDAGTSSYVQRVASYGLSTDSEKADIRPIAVLPITTPETDRHLVAPVQANAETPTTIHAAPNETRHPEPERTHKSWDTFGDF